MIATIRTTTPTLSLDQDQDHPFERFDLSELTSPPRSSSQGFRTRRPSDLRTLITRLFQLNLSSLSAYAEIADLTTDPELRDFAEVMTRQRMAQCRALSRFVQHIPPAGYNSAICPLRSAWLRALWSLEQNDRVAFAEAAEHAESLLEDAFVEAADATVEQPVADLLYELAINVCGARERIEELASLHIDG